MGARNPEIRRRYGTVADSYMYDDVRTRANVTDGPIPIDPADAAQLRRVVGLMLRWSRPIMKINSGQVGGMKPLALIFLLHTLLVVIVVAMKEAFWGTDVPWWHLQRILLIVDMPMEWAIRPLLQSLPALPPPLVLNRIGIAGAVNEVFVHALLGGAFYVGIGALVMFSRHLVRRRSHVRIEVTSPPRRPPVA